MKNRYGQKKARVKKVIFLRNPLKYMDISISVCCQLTSFCINSIDVGLKAHQRTHRGLGTKRTFITKFIL